MTRLDDSCREIVGGVAGALACGVLDLRSGVLLGSFHAPTAPPLLHDFAASAVLDLLGDMHVARLERMVRGDAEPSPEAAASAREVHVASNQGHHFIRTFGDRRLALVLVTDARTSLGLGWAHVRRAADTLEALSG